MKIIIRCEVLLTFEAETFEELVENLGLAEDLTSEVADNPGLDQKAYVHDFLVDNVPAEFNDYQDNCNDYIVDVKKIDGLD
jgi:hypothetical protein